MKNRKASLLLVISVFLGMLEAITTSVQTYALGETDGSINFSTVTQQYLTVPGNEAFFFDKENFTIEGWEYSQDATGGDLVEMNDGLDSYLIVGINADGTWRMVWNNGNVRVAQPNSGIYKTSVKTWNHFALVRNGDLLTLYVNGIAFIASTGVVNNSMGYNNRTLGIGADPVSGQNRGNYNLADIRIVKGTAVYNYGQTLGTTYFSTPNSRLTAVTGTQFLLSTYSGASFLQDFSANAFSVTNVSSRATSSTSSPYAQGSILFNGSQSITASGGTGAAMRTDDFTWEMWVFPTSFVGAYPAILDSRIVRNANELGIVMQPAGANLNSRTLSILSPESPPSGTNGTLTLNSWQHIAVVRKSSQIRLFVNGLSAGVADYGNDLTQTQFHIGKNRNGADFFNGNISAIRMVKGTALYGGANFADTGSLQVNNLPTSILGSISGTTFLLNTQYDNLGNNWKLVKSNGYVTPTLSPVTGISDLAHPAYPSAQLSSTTSISCPSSQTYTGLAITPCTATVTGDGGLNETATVTYSNNISVGTATVTASFAANANYLASSASTTFTISKRATSIAFTCTANQVYTGSALTPCSATLTGSGGLVETATVTYGSNTNAGTATISASYAGAATYEASSGSGTFLIAKAPSSVVTSCSNQTYSGGALAPCTATVTGVGGLNETITPTYSSNTDAGTASVTASYVGDSNHEASASVTTFAIGQAGSTTSFTASTSALILGESVTLTAAVTSGATGVVTFKDAALNSLCVTANLSAGSASCSWTPGSVATFAVSAFYLGDNNFTASNSAGSNIVVTPVTHTVTYNANGGTSVLDSATVLNGNTLVLTTASRYGYHFDGWFTSQNGGTQVSSPYAATSSSTIWARWTQSSLYGLTSAELGTPDSVESDLSRTKIISTEFGSTSSTIRIPAGAFLNPTTVDVYTLADNAFAEGRIPDSNVYIISQVVAWRESNGTIPIAQSAVQMTITSPSIKVGAIVYSIVDGVVRTTDTATVAGSITILMTEDPIIVVAEAPVTPPCNCQQQNQIIVMRDPEPVVVEPKKEVAEEAKEEIAVEPKKEVVEEVNEEVVEVSVPTPKINRVYKSQLKIYFDLGSATVNAKSLKIISDFLGKLSKNYQRMKITAIGFTQPTLINPYPEALSQARAKSVIQIVKRYGLPAKYQYIGKGNALTNSDKSRYVNLTITRTEAANA